MMAMCLARGALVGASQDTLPRSQWQGLWDVCYDLSRRFCDLGAHYPLRKPLGTRLGLFATELCVGGVYLCVCMHTRKCTWSLYPAAVRWWPFQSSWGGGQMEGRAGTCVPWSTVGCICVWLRSLLSQTSPYSP